MSVYGVVHGRIAKLWLVELAVKLQNCCELNFRPGRYLSPIAIFKERATRDSKQLRGLTQMKAIGCPHIIGKFGDVPDDLSAL
jgi:hypothetical protein